MVWRGTFSRIDLEVARCFTTGLLFEAAVYPKPGLADRVNQLREINIYRLSASAASLYPYYAMASALGRTRRIRNALGLLVIDAVREMVRVQAGGNMHLGALLLTLPLAAGAGKLGLRIRSPEALRRATSAVLASLGHLDTINVFRAIEHARPGGLGNVPFLDVTRPETYELLERVRPGLLEALEPYCGRDMVADELLTGYPLVFNVCLRSMRYWDVRVESLETACVNALLAVMAYRPDTHIVRRRGVETARIVQHMAEAALSLGGASSVKGLEAVQELDTYLRRVDARPGSSADILAASLGVRILLGLRA